MSYEFADRPSLESALKLWCTDPSMAALTYGDIGKWNVGFVSDFGNLFSTMNLAGNDTYNGELYYSYAYNDDWVDQNAEPCAAIDVSGSSSSTISSPSDAASAAVPSAYAACASRTAASLARLAICSNVSPVYVSTPSTTPTPDATLTC